MVENLKLEKGSVALIKSADPVRGTKAIIFAPPLDCQERERLVERLRIEDANEQPLSLSQRPTKLKEEQEQPDVASIPIRDCPPVQKEQ
ncbi:hypothetical protein NC652_020795 [Populus alba x Populus x berolinensis]|uniref:Uncharacterized protein n=1 Tax=Populus alba x Populus x berolinensis TaxID=444605 RepID=A0AAD6MKT1_9ROSI|nr:hypothetical protein NC652_020795 [Populus alba x Populus x berolinensis]KAJ6987403.1 hypothetical protein NC653_020610 [Populus alba x Populus x berolinensis]